MNNQRHTARTERIQQQRESGFMKTHYPRVTSISIRMKYSQKGIAKSLQRVVHFSPDSYAFFRINCLNKDCIDGGFDFTRLITTMIKNQSTETSGELLCDGGEEAASGHSAVAYEVAIRYS